MLLRQFRPNWMNQTREHDDSDVWARQIRNQFYEGKKAA